MTTSPRRQAPRSLAKLSARSGERDEAIGLAQQAVAITQITESPMYRGEALSDLAEVLHAFGKDAEAHASLNAALDQFKLKGASARVEQALKRRAEMEAE